MNGSFDGSGVEGWGIFFSLDFMPPLAVFPAPTVSHPSIMPNSPCELAHDSWGDHELSPPIVQHVVLVLAVYSL